MRLKIAVSVVRSRPWAPFEFNSYKRLWFEIRGSTGAQRSRVQGVPAEARTVSDAAKEKARIAAGFFALPTAVSASAEAKAYARPSVTITPAIIRPTVTTVIPAIIRPRSVAVASIIGAVVTIAIVAITTARADVG